MRKVFLVSCVSKKMDESCAAKDMYQSDWFKKARAYVVSQEGTWYILSAKYGLLKPQDMISPYELTLNKMAITERKAWAEKVGRQLAPLILSDDHVTVLAGMKYREFLMPTLMGFAAKVEVPMEGLRIGKQLAWLGNRHG